MKLAQKIITLLLTLSISPSYAFAQQQQSVGMHHLTPKPALQQIPSTEPTEAESSNQDQPTAPVYKPLTPKEALVEPDDLEKWSHLDEAASAYSKENIAKLVHIIESDRGAVPPQGLFLAAKALSDSKHMEQAALYFFAGQLRLTFDVTRWPPRANKEDIKRLTEGNKKTEDQSAPNRDTSPRINNPHTGVSELANSIGSPILAWAMKNPKRLDNTLNKVREWDISAPYAYDPGYTVGESIPFEKWENTLTKVRTSYFSRMNELTKALGKMK